MNNKIRAVLAATMLLCSVALIAFGLFGNFGDSENKRILATLSPTQAHRSSIKSNTKATEKVDETTPAAAHTHSGSQAKANYVLNSSSKVFHHPWCSYSDKIDEENLELVNISRNDLLQSGYKPCSKCEP